MPEISAVMSKLSGVRRAIANVLTENVSRNRSSGEIRVRGSFPPELVQHYFVQASDQVEVLRAALADLYGDFQAISTAPELLMAPPPDAPQETHFSRPQLERLARDIDQIFEVRANTELYQPQDSRAVHRRVFITHGRAQDWRAVQTFLEKDCGFHTMELTQQPNMGNTVIEKLFSGAEECDSAVIVMTAEDFTADDVRVRENVMHELGFFQGKFGRTRVVLLHEDGTNIPSNLSGVVYIPFPKNLIESGFHVLDRELKAIYEGVP